MAPPTALIAPDGASIDTDEYISANWTSRFEISRSRQTRLDPERAPFGITVMAWEKVIDAADDLAAALTEDRDNVSLAAGHLKAILRPYV